jgi:hypothetical protein
MKRFLFLASLALLSGCAGYVNDSHIFLGEDSAIEIRVQTGDFVSKPKDSASPLVKQLETVGLKRVSRMSCSRDVATNKCVDNLETMSVRYAKKRTCILRSDEHPFSFKATCNDGVKVVRFSTTDNDGLLALRRYLTGLPLD